MLFSQVPEYLTRCCTKVFCGSHPTIQLGCYVPHQEKTDNSSESDFICVPCALHCVPRATPILLTSNVSRYKEFVCRCEHLSSIKCLFSGRTHEELSNEALEQYQTDLLKVYVEHLHLEVSSTVLKPCSDISKVCRAVLQDTTTASIIPHELKTTVEEMRNQLQLQQKESDDTLFINIVRHV
eukprot:PhF_6_TR21929/c0_g1_i1/m.31151